MATIASLPTEIVGSILSYLNIRSLLSFSATNKNNQLQARYSLLKLDLAILPRQVHCSLALASQYCRDEVQGDIDPPQFGIGKITHSPVALNRENQNPTTIRQIQIQAQNQIAIDILTQQSVQNLQSLALHMYDIQSGDLADTIGQKLPHLRNLELNFCHPFIHNSGTSSSYWRHASEGTPCWNSLVGLGSENQRHLHLKNLQSLKVDRAGLTSAQLRKLVESNPGLRILSLKNVTGVDLEFLNWLARRTEDGKSNIRILELENCPKLAMQRLNDFACVFGLAHGVIEYMSLRNCPNVKEQVFEDLANENCALGSEFRAFDTFVLPSGRKSHYGSLDSAFNKVQEGASPGQWNWTSGKIDVDPGYTVQPMAAVA